MVWCGRWDSNPRTPTGQAPQACASTTLDRKGLFDLAWQLPHTKSLPVLQLRRWKALIGFPRCIQNPVWIDSTGKTFNSAATGPTEHSD